MLYHCGLLDEDKTKSRSYNWVMRRGWFEEGFPPDVLHDMAVWFAMPGFNLSYHWKNLRVQDHQIVEAKQRLCPDFELLREDVTKNWMSATREDRIKICQMRPGQSGIPLICQLSILDDVKAGLTQGRAAEIYGVTRRWVERLVANRAPIGSKHWHIPAGFELLVHRV